MYHQYCGFSERVAFKVVTFGLPCTIQTSVTYLPTQARTQTSSWGGGGFFYGEVDLLGESGGVLPHALKIY